MESERDNHLVADKTEATVLSMLRRTVRGRAAAALSGFSSGAFTGDDDAYRGLAQERQRIEDEHRANNAERSRVFTDKDATSTNTPADRAKYEGLTRPTIDTYKAMTDEELITVLRTREKQVGQLRRVYENFHYEADKHYRKMVLDYHDKALQFSQVHGRMQNASLQINREALVKMREEQEMLDRDKRLVFLACTVITACFWLWVRRHYVKKKELETQMEADTYDSKLRSSMATSVTGSGSWNDNLFGSTKRSGRSWETTWERETRERRQRKAQLSASEEKRSAIEAELLRERGQTDEAAKNASV